MYWAAIAWEEASCEGLANAWKKLLPLSNNSECDNPDDLDHGLQVWTMMRSFRKCLLSLATRKIITSGRVLQNGCKMTVMTLGGNR